MQTAGLVAGGLKADLDRLSEDEQHKVIELVGIAGAGGAWSWQKLTKKQRTTLEELVEKAADNPRFFADARAAAEIQALAASAHKAAVRRPFTRREESGLLRELGDHLVHGYLTADQIAPLLVVFASLERGEAFAPQGRVERDPDGEPVLIVSKSYGLLTERQDWRGSMGAWRQALDHLAKNAWITLDASGGNQYEIRLGSRSKRAMRGTAGEKVAA
jgi:hypothetical protein